MPEKAIDQVLRAHTAKAMEEILYIGESDAIEILKNFDADEVKLFFQNIPKIREYILFLSEEYSSYFASYNKNNVPNVPIEEFEHFLSYRIPTHQDPALYIGIPIANPPEFSAEFKELFEKKKPALLTKKLAQLFAVIQKLLSKYNSEESLFFIDGNLYPTSVGKKILAYLTPTTLPKFYDYLANGTNEIIASIKDYKKDDKIDDLVGKISNLLETKFKDVPPEIRSYIISPRDIRKLIIADRALQDILLIEHYETRRDILLGWHPGTYDLIPDVAAALKKAVLDSIQWPVGRNRGELVETIFSYGYLLRLEEPLLTRLSHGEEMFFSTMLSEKFLNIIRGLPDIVGADIYDHQLEPALYVKNQKGIEKIYELLSSGLDPDIVSTIYKTDHTVLYELPLNNFSYQFQSLSPYLPPPPEPGPWFTKNQAVFSGIALTAVGVICLAAYLYRSARRSAGFWSKKLGLSTGGKNNLLLEHLESLPKSESRPEFLSEKEITKFKEYIEKLTDSDLKEANQNILEQYENFMEKTCAITLDTVKDIKDPLTIDAIYYTNPIREWTHIYNFEDLVNYIKQLNNSDVVARKFPKPAIDPVTRDPLVPDNNSTIIFKRGYPDFLDETIKAARRVIPPQEKSPSHTSISMFDRPDETKEENSDSEMEEQEPLLKQNKKG